MEFLLNIIDNAVSLFWIILGFGALIFIHELGHFLAAKWAGIRAEGFAVGMGPVLLGWRKGIGLRFGSTLREYEKLVRDHIRQHGSDELKEKERTSELRPEDLYRVGDDLGFGETEYSLRWLPIGGFVKMLGQEDANPNYVSDDARSYNRCSIGKRMVVVSAGVIMNVILAAALFVWAFLAGVRFEAPVIGDVSSLLPAGQTMPDNAQVLGISTPGLQPGDRVTTIDGEPAHTFADLQIASAMSRSDQSIHLAVQREGVQGDLLFTLAPELDSISGLRSIGVSPGRSATLIDIDRDGIIAGELQLNGLSALNVEPGMRLLSVSGESVSTFHRVQQLAARSEGRPLDTTWTRLNKDGQPTGDEITASVGVKPEYQLLRYPELTEDNVRQFDFGLIGLAPLTRITQILPGSSNEGILRVDDIVLRIDNVEGPRSSQFRNELQAHASGEIELEVLRDGAPVTVRAHVNRKGQLKVGIGPALDVPLVAQTFDEVAGEPIGDQPGKVVPTPVADLRLMPRTRIDSINDRPVADWRDLWTALREETREAGIAGNGAELAIRVTHPTPGRESETMTLSLTDDDVRDLQELNWQCALPNYIFDAIYTIRSAGGDPIHAFTMGVQETHKLIMMTYLTIDRLIRRTVGVEQLRGPVGIMHIGVTIVDRGFIYMLFFLGMISVNLAVINFLPLPIVDGGLFLFLIYEKLKGRPPSIAFQSAATLVGLFLIGTIFIVTFYNDVMRLLS